MSDRRLCASAHRCLVAANRARSDAGTAAESRCGSVCTREQRRSTPGRYTGRMQLFSIKFVIATLWVSAVSIAGVAADVHSIGGWTILGALAVVPPLVMLRRWTEPQQSISESIQEARR